MEPYSYFITAAVLFILSLGAASPIAGGAMLAASVITLIGGLYTKFVVR